VFVADLDAVCSVSSGKKSKEIKSINYTHNNSCFEMHFTIATPLMSVDPNSMVEYYDNHDYLNDNEEKIFLVLYCKYAQWHLTLKLSVVNLSDDVVS